MSLLWQLPCRVTRPCRIYVSKEGGSVASEIELTSCFCLTPTSPYPPPPPPHIHNPHRPFAAPKKILVVPDLPKTRSGKLIRRALRKISAGEGDQLGDMSTAADPSILDIIKEKVAASEKK